MESLYRKYRPLTFGSVVGQQHIVSTLEHAVAEGRLSHAYLFCGPRGTGKTTMARILAKSLLCEGAEAARAEGASGCMPDGTCPECEAIAAGTHPDVYELDAASRTGVDNVREEIINSVSFAPVRGAYKVYIIDEVHMLTTAAFNALLKTLEEPPSHVIFVLCTTDPQKILETILSRCQRFDFHRISNDDIVGRLRYICEQESFAFDDEALEIVARHARGGMRDALSTLEQLSVFGDGSVRVDDARSLLGEVASTVLSEFSQKIAERNTVELFGLVRAQADEGNDLMELTHDLVAHMRDVYTASIAGAKPELFDGTPEEVAALVEEARLFGDPDRLARALTLLDDAALEMRDASDPRLVLEIALTRLARPESDLTIEALAERLARLEAQIAAGVPSAPMTPAQRAAAVGESHGVPAAAVAAPRTPHAGGAGARGAGAVPARGAGAA
ncbi:MAG: DNA polymerase III subunit gamma/tau, partial [Coriobacteriaceae bacterium]|nr:DNA polymerase III subunit gamma/tau [Coriobacteriaceae bacterium]